MADEELLTGEFLAGNGKARVARKWDEIACALNAINGGAVKTGTEWKEALNNLKSRARKAFNEKLKYKAGTGGGVPPAAADLGLSSVYSKCCALMGLVSIVGDSDVPHPLQIQKRKQECSERNRGYSSPYSPYTNRGSNQNSCDIGRKDPSGSGTKRGYSSPYSPINNRTTNQNSHDIGKKDPSGSGTKSGYSSPYSPINNRTTNRHFHGMGSEARWSSQINRAHYSPHSSFNNRTANQHYHGLGRETRRGPEMNCGYDSSPYSPFNNRATNQSSHSMGTKALLGSEINHQYPWCYSPKEYCSPTKDLPLQSNSKVHRINLGSPSHTALDNSGRTPRGEHYKLNSGNGTPQGGSARKTLTYTGTDSQRTGDLAGIEELKADPDWQEKFLEAL